MQLVVKMDKHFFFIEYDMSTLKYIFTFLPPECPALFSTTAGDFSGFDDAVEVLFTMDETTPTETELYELSWDDDCVEPPDITDENFNKYFFVNDTGDCSWIVSVNTDLIGVPDYPDPQVSQHSSRGIVTSPLASSIIASTCALLICHSLFHYSFTKLHRYAYNVTHV